MRVADLFPSKFVTASDLRGQVIDCTISRVTLEELDGKKKPVLWFAGASKGLMLNKTNAKVIARMHGEELTAWAGRSISIYPSECSFKGEIVPCIRVKSEVPLIGGNKPAVATPPPPPVETKSTDELPF